MKNKNKYFLPVIAVLFLILVVVSNYLGSTLAIDSESLTKNSTITYDLSKITSEYTTFNRYTIKYTSDVYIKGIMTYKINGVEEKERFYLEPSTNGTFSSFINGYNGMVNASGELIDTERVVNNTDITSITFENIGDSTGTFNISSFELILYPPITDLINWINGETVVDDYYKKQQTVFIGSDNIKVGLSLRYGGSINYISGNSTIFSDNYANINVINSSDNGRFIQQCYYGNQYYKDGNKYVDDTSACNSVGGMYNPIQGGFTARANSCGAPAYTEYNSKIVDIGISEDGNWIGIKTKPSLWELTNENYKKEYYDYYKGFTADAYMLTEYTVHDTYISVTNSYIDFTDNVNDTATSKYARAEAPSVYTISALKDIYAYSMKSDTIRKYEIGEPNELGEKHFINDEEQPNADGTHKDAIWSYWGGYFDTNSGITEGIGIYRPDYDQIVAGAYIHGFTTGNTTDKTTSGSSTSFLAPIMHLNNNKIGKFKKIEYDYVVTLGNINNVQTIMNTYRNDHSYTLKIDPNGGLFNNSKNPTTANEKLLIYWGNWNKIAKSTRTGYDFQGYYDAKNGGTKVYDSSGTAVTSKYWKVNPAGAAELNLVELQYQYIGKQDLTVYAKWTPKVYSITYELNGGTVTGNPSSYTIETETFTLNNPTKENYNFDGWRDESTGIISKTVTIPKGSTDGKRYTAIFSEIPQEPLVQYTFDEVLEVNETNKCILYSKGSISVSDMLDKIEIYGTNINITIYDQTMKERANDSLVATGDKLSIYKNNVKLEEYTIIVLGDINSDGQISVTDVSKLFQHYRNKIAMEDMHIKASNIINDSEIKLTDVAKLYQYVRNKISNLR